ncbi:RIIB early lysis inhibitor [Serratia phage SP1]|nr:RIIB early lysis inhibitor [Serratia phage SP1]
MTVRILNELQQYHVQVQRGQGATLKELARKFGVSTDTISKVVKSRQILAVDANLQAPFEFAEMFGDYLSESKRFVFLIPEDRDVDFYVNLIEQLEVERDSYEWKKWKLDYFELALSVLRDFVQAARNKAPVNVDSDREDFELPEIDESKVIWSGNSRFLSIVVDGQVYNADSTLPNFKVALQACVDGQFAKAVAIVNVERAIKSYTSKSGKVEIVDGTLKYEGLAIHSSLTTRIIDRMNEGKNFEFFIPFLENLMLNPSEKAVQRTFDFLEANDIQITASGHFAAWKKVRSDYKDIYTGTFDNSVGKEPSMPRNMVDEDDERTCSRGLHVCSRSYLGSYGSCSGNRIMQVLVNPKDVVSVPTDYSNAKMRVCTYKVIADATETFHL